MELPVKNTKGQVVGTAQLSDALFAAPMNYGVVHQALVMYQQNKRQGTHSTKTRAEVSGGGRKPWPQKGTGRARQGSTRSPHWRHGGVAFGPKPRDHRLAMPRKMRHRALKCVLSEKVRKDRLIILDGIQLEAPSTKAMIEILGNLGVTASTLIVTSESQQSVVHSARNLRKVWTLPVALINAQQLLNRDLVIMTLDAAHKAEELWAQVPSRRDARSKISSGSPVGGTEHSPGER